MNTLRSTFFRLSSLAICLYVHFMAASVLKADINIEPSESVHANVGVNFSGILERSMLQRSDDLLNWTDIMPVGVEVNESSLPDPTSKEKKSLFYRLKAISNSSEGRFYVNLHPTDSHLFSYRLGGDIEFHVYGTRDQAGLPKDITEYIFRAGNTLYTGSNPETESAPSSPNTKSPQDTARDGYSHIHGYVFVENSEDCPASQVPPSVQWRVTEHTELGYTGEPVFGQLQTAPAQADFQVEGFKVYTYSIPWRSSGYQVPPPVDMKQFSQDVFAVWLGKIIPTDGISMSGAGLEILAEKYGTKLNPLVGAGSALLSIVMANIAAEAAIDNYDHGPTEAYGSYDAFEIEARAIIPDGVGGFTQATPWNKFIPAFLATGPDFIVTDPCPVKTITITQGYSVSFHGNASHTHSFDFSQILDPNLVIIEKADWSIDYNYANTVVNTMFGERTARSGQIDRKGYFWIEAASDNSSKIIPPPNVVGYPSVNNSGGLWNHSSTNQYLNLNVPVGAHSFTVQGNAVKLKMLDTNSTSLAQYSDPFTVSVAGWSAHSAISYGFASTPPAIIDSTALNVSATISIKVYYRKR